MLIKALVRITPKTNMAQISFDTYFHFLESDLVTTAVYVRSSKQLLNVLPTVKWNALIRKGIMESRHYKISFNVLNLKHSCAHC